MAVGNIHSLFSVILSYFSNHFPAKSDRFHQGTSMNTQFFCRQPSTIYVTVIVDLIVFRKCAFFQNPAKLTKVRIFLPFPLEFFSRLAHYKSDITNWCCWQRNKLFGSYGCFLRKTTRRTCQKMFASKNGARSWEISELNLECGKQTTHIWLKIALHRIYCPVILTQMLWKQHNCQCGRIEIASLQIQMLSNLEARTKKPNTMREISSSGKNGTKKRVSTNINLDRSIAIFIQIFSDINATSHVRSSQFARSPGHCAANNWLEFGGLN